MTRILAETRIKEANNEVDNAAAVKAKEVALDAALKTADNHVEKTLISARKDRDLAASTAAKAASDANDIMKTRFYL